MSTERSTAVTLPAGVMSVVEWRKMRNAMAAALAKTSWGTNVDDGIRRAVADWAYRFKVDAATEIDVLGGRIYLNSRFYLRKLAELMQQGIITKWAMEHVEVDPRLDEILGRAVPDNPALAKEVTDQQLWAFHEKLRRERARIEHHLDDKAVAAVVCYATVRGMTEPVVGAKWCGNKGKVKRTRRDGGTYEVDADPIGDAFPVETAESRAARRCLRAVVSHVPEVGDEIEAALVASDDLTDVIQQQLAETRELDQLPPPARPAVNENAFEEELERGSEQVASEVAEVQGQDPAELL